MEYDIPAHQCNRGRHMCVLKWNGSSLALDILSLFVCVAAFLEIPNLGCPTVGIGYSRSYNVLL